MQAGIPLLKSHKLGATPDERQCFDNLSTFDSIDALLLTGEISVRDTCSGGEVQPQCKSSSIIPRLLNSLIFVRSNVCILDTNYVYGEQYSCLAQNIFEFSM